MNLRATQPLEAPPAAAGARFAYASGDRPLDGYTIKRGIGRGGFGEVYYALSDGGKEVALKLICRNLEVELRGVTQCLNIKHPNLLSLFDIRQDDHDESWVVMEYVAGDSLERVVQRHPDGMPIDDVMFWMQGIAAAVEYLHHHGIIHRDLKPGNIFCDEGVVKVGDYGLSKFISCSRRSGQTGSVGTVHYMAPEVANGRYGKEIDIYALGIMLYEMITGRVPFEGESLGEVLMKHLTAQPDLTSIAEPYRTAIARALAKDPDARPHTVVEFMSLLPRPLHATLASLGPVPLPPPLARDRVQREPVQRDHVQPRQPSVENGRAAPLPAAASRLKPPMAQLVDAIPVAAPTARPARYESSTWRRWREGSPPAPPPAVGRRERLADLIGSMLLAAVVVSVVSLVVVLFRMSTRGGGPIEPNQYAWLALSAVAGAWSIMIPAKVWEFRPADAALRRFVMLVAGLGVGLIAHALHTSLLVHLPYDIHDQKVREMVISHFPQSFYGADGTPLVCAFLAYFGLLWLAPRWWRHAYSRRSTRLSFWMVGTALVWAAIVNCLSPFPQPWGLMFAATVSIAVQLASTWEPKRAQA
jgi:serine/threonine protein kinase